MLKFQDFTSFEIKNVEEVQMQNFGNPTLKLIKKC